MLAVVNLIVFAMSTPHQILESDNEDETSAEANKRRRGVAFELLPGGVGGRIRHYKSSEPGWNLEACPPPFRHSAAAAPLPAASTCPPAPRGGPRVREVPDGSRSLIDNEPLANLIKNTALCKMCPYENKDDLGVLHFFCPAGQAGGCGGGFASRPMLICDVCEHEAQVPHVTTSVPHGQFNHKKASDDPVNMALAMSMIAHGDGGVEAGSVLGFLDLCHPTTFETGTFHNMEMEMMFSVEQIAQQALRSAVFEEVEKSLHLQPVGFDFQRWKQAVKAKGSGLATDYPVGLCAKVRCSDDMGWNKRSSGKQRNSRSGHCLALGCESGNPLALASMVNWCRYCDQPKYKGPEGSKIRPPPHTCYKNYKSNDSSGGMESAGLLQMMHHVWDNYFLYFFEIVTDDDSTMKARCRWSNDDYEKHHGCRPMVEGKGKDAGKMVEWTEKGKLRYPIPEPKFLADPAHRKKTFRDHLYKLKNRHDPETAGHLTKEGKKKRMSLLGTTLGFTDIDILRLTRNFAYMSRQLKDIPKNKWEEAGRAVVEHHFDNHEFCGDFCVRKKELAQNIDDPLKTYRSPTDDKRLYQLLQETLEHFISVSRLEEIGHGFHTNGNESFNNTLSYFAPKNRTFSGSCSLKLRTLFAVCIKILGFASFFTSLFIKLGMTVPNGTRHYFKTVGDAKFRHLEYSRRAEVKNKRNAKTNEKLKAYRKEKAKAKKEGAADCETGVGMSIGDTVSVSGNTAGHPAGGGNPDGRNKRKSSTSKPRSRKVPPRAPVKKKRGRPKKIPRTPDEEMLPNPKISPATQPVPPQTQALDGAEQDLLDRNVQDDAFDDR